MKNRFLLIFCFLSWSCALFAQTETLTNQSVVDMASIGFSDDVIIAKIRSSEAAFDTSIDSLKALKEKGVSDNVILAILEHVKASQEIEEITESDEQPKQNNRLGIYVIQNGEVVKMYPSVFSGTKTNTIGTALTYGLASTTVESILNGETSSTVISARHPEFMFYFSRPDNADLNNNGNNWWFFTASSPKEFALVMLERKKGRRVLGTGSVNIYSGTNFGVDDEIPFETIQVDEYTFKVVPSVPLESGEYGFFYKGVIPNGGYGNSSVFDFTIDLREVKAKYDISEDIYIWKEEKARAYTITEILFEDGIICYKLIPRSGFGKTIVVPESKCFPSKKIAARLKRSVD